MPKDKKKVVYEAGILLSLVGIPISSVINEYLQGKFEVTNFLLLISLFLVADWKRLLSLKLRINPGIFMILLFQIYVVVIETIAGQALFETARGMIYTLFMIVILIFASSRKMIDAPDHFIKTTWFILGFFNVLLFFLLTDYLSSFSIIGKTVLDYGADRLTLSKLGFSFLISHLVYVKSNNRKNMVLSVAFIISTLFNLLYCSRRATIIYFIGILILHYFFYEKILSALNKVTRKKLIKVIGTIATAIVVSIILINLIPNLSETISRYMQSVLNAYNTLIGRSQIDVSASTRNMLRNQALSWLKTSSFTQLLLGRGYMYKYLDFPILQAIIDMGIMGVFYIYIQMVYSLKYFANRNTNVAERFFQYYALIYFFDNFFAGIPYGYGKFIPIMYLFLQVRPVRIKKHK